MEPEYRIEDGRYAFYLEDRLFDSDEVAILFDAELGSLLKHGQPDLVEAYHQKLRQAFVAGGLFREAENLICVTGKFELEELNKVVSICDYAGRFYAKLMSQHSGEPV